ncbi:MAG TPA: tetratricopeptide repeat protein [bacterium]|nr:tetratricopeptide repeat protein [bacterium]
MAKPENPASQVPPRFSFVSLPKGLAQFHHLPQHVPIEAYRQEEVEKKGYDFAEGARVMEELLKEAPAVPGAYLFHLFVDKWPKLKEVEPFFVSGRIAEAIPKLVEILDIDPECPLTSFQLGFCFRATGELEKSESFYKKALRMAPAAGWIYPNLGRTYLAMDRKAEAAQAFWKALELLPGDPFVLDQLMALGELFLLPPVSGRPEDPPFFVKRSDYEKKMREGLGQEKDPDNILALGWKLLQDRLLDLAGEAFERAKAAGRKDALLGLGIVQAEARRFAEAERSLEEYLEEHPDSAPAHLNLFKVYLAQEEMDLAWEEIQAAVRSEPERLDALRQLYQLFLQDDRREEALDWFEGLSKEKPESFAPHLARAWALAEADWPAARVELEKARLLAPDQEEVLLFLTAELGKRGEREEVVRLLEPQAGKLPLSLTINLALAHSQEGRSARGKELLEAYRQRPGLGNLEKERVERILAEFAKAGPAA